MLDPENYPQARQSVQTPWTADQQKFQQWLALPRSMRAPGLQQELAIQIGVHESTLCRWKKLPGFQDAVNVIMKDELLLHVPDVLEALVQQAKAGRIEAIRDLLAISGFYNHARDAALSVHVVPQVIDPHHARRLADLAEQLEAEEEQGSQDPPTFPFRI